MSPDAGWWERLEGPYSSEAFVCTNWVGDEIQKTKDRTQDPIGGIGYNIFPLSKEGYSGGFNANWGRQATPTKLARITEPTRRICFASAYDWHLVGGETVRAYDRFGPDQAAAAFWDGHVAMVDRETYDNAISSPEIYSRD